MKETPLLMCGEMVRATLEDRKTQTRRVLLKSGRDADYDFTEMRGIRAIFNANRPAKRRELLMPCFGVNCPYGQPGDRLWVRETFALHKKHDHLAPIHAPKDIRFYFDEHGQQTGTNPRIGKWRPSIFMPRWHSRLALEITDVRVQRVQEIIPADVIAEGCPFRFSGTSPEDAPDWIGWYKNLWDSLNKKRGFGWDANCWIWAITFRRVK